MATLKSTSKIGQRVLSSAEIRNRFINFFKSKEHIFIKSSSVQPFADRTLEFTNAGMNQFKNIFLGSTCPPVNRAVNSQKCIRVGGKHNDLDVVGHDSYHHTFFEMLGNWSFGDYFKVDACSYALELILSEPYSLPLDRLYFTYFCGDKSLGLQPDLETRDIWLHLGISEDRIIGFGLKDNFWEMGSTGPCGPCTEIHYDHIGSEPRPHAVNSDSPDLTELWNIVFIQYNRQEDGNLTELAQSFVDTGMGLERLVALLQGKHSNYDSDLFLPLFNTISETSRAPTYRGRYGSEDVNQIDTKYRILADHARMITISISDHMLPDYSHSLRRVIRRSLLVANSLSPDSGSQLLSSVVKSAATSLSHFPLVCTNYSQIDRILKDEIELFKYVRKDTQKEWKKLLQQEPRLESLTDCQSTGLIEAYKYLKRNPESDNKVLETEQAIICYDRFGLSISLIEQLAHIKGYSVNKDDFEIAKSKLKEYNKSLTTTQFNNNIDLAGLAFTDHSASYASTRDSTTGSYSFENIKTEVERGWIGGRVLKEGNGITDGCRIDLLLKDTAFHAPHIPSSNSSSLGHIMLTNSHGHEARFQVVETRRIHGRILHSGSITSLNEGQNKNFIYDDDWQAQCFVDNKTVQNVMRNTTAALILETVLKSKYDGTMTYLNCESERFSAKFNVCGQLITVSDVYEIEKEVNNIIEGGVEFNVETISAKTLFSDEYLIIPPYLNTNLPFYQLVASLNNSIKLRTVTMSPNVHNSKDISRLCFTGFRLGKRNRECTVNCITGPHIHESLYQPVLNLIDKLKSLSNQTDLNKLTKEAKRLLSDKKVPLELQGTLKKSVDGVKETIKKFKLAN